MLTNFSRYTRYGTAQQSEQKISEIIRVTSYQSIADIYRFESNSIVIIYIDAAQVSYNVHKYILYNISLVFTVIFTDKFKKNSTNTVKLSENNYKIFE